MASYHCEYCGTDFEAAGEPARCPKCMRKTGLEAGVSDEATLSSPRKRLGLVVAVFCLLAGVGAIYFGLRPPAEEVARQALQTSLKRAGVSKPTYLALLEGGAPLDEVVASLPASDLQSALEWFREQVAAQSKQEISKRLLMRKVFSAEKAFEALKQPASLYSLERALALNALLRKVGVQSAVAEHWPELSPRGPGEGHELLGEFIIVVQGEEAESYDHNAARLENASGELRILSDQETVAAAMAIEAARSLYRRAQPDLALNIVDKALRLDPKNPRLRVLHALTLSASGINDEALREMNAALQLRSDPSFVLHQVELEVAQSGMFSMQGDSAEAERILAKALKRMVALKQEYPQWARVHLLEAAVQVALGELGNAELALRACEKLDPRQPGLQLIWARLHYANDREEEALRAARLEAHAQPEDWQVQLGAAQIYHALSRYEELSEAIERTLALVPEVAKPRLREQIQAMFGPGALEDPDSYAQGQDDSSGGLELPELDLGADVSALPDPDLAGEGGFQLRDPDLQLRLGDTE